MNVNLLQTGGRSEKSMKSTACDADRSKQNATVNCPTFDVRFRKIARP